MVDWHAIETQKVLGILSSSENGLAQVEAKKRLEKYGKNEIRSNIQIKPFMIFLEQFKSVFILILFAAAIFSLYIRHYLDFFVILAIVLLNSLVGFFQQYKAEKAILAMKNILVPRAHVIRNGQLLEIPSNEIVVGDIIQISEGDKIMADCRVIHSNELQTNEAVLTGESFSQKKSNIILKQETELANRENMLFTGTLAVSGSAKAIVVETGMNTEFGKIAGLVQEIKIVKTPLEKKLDDFSKKLAIVVIVLALISILVGIFRGEVIADMVLTGVALAISVIPEGVPAIIAITLALAIGRMQKKNVLIRKLPAAETLGRTTVICTDKTGTLTQEEMTVTKLYTSREYYDIKNNSVYHENKKIDFSDFNIQTLFRIGALCNNSRIEKDKSGKIISLIGDPTEKALLLAAENAGIFKKAETEKEIRLKEYSFSSSRKLMSIVRGSDHKVISYVKGAAEVVIKRCTKELINGRPIHLTEKRKKELESIAELLSSSGLRVLGFAFKQVDFNFNQESSENGLTFTGFQGIMDPPRKEVPQAIRDCLDAGIKVKMITGDSLATAIAISKMIGLPQEGIDEKELQKLSDKEFSDIVREKCVFARITAQTKLRIIKTLKEQEEIVAVTGDGVNDVLALKEAHIGVAMGIRGTEVSREVSDIILLDDNFNSVVNGVREGRRVYDNLKKSIKAHISANVGELFVVLLALLLTMPIPLMPLAILWMNLITDSLPSLALAFEPADRDLMSRKPISKKETIINGMIPFLTIAGILSVIAALGMFMFYSQTDLAKARTITLTTLVFCEMFIVLSCRSERKISEIGFFSNKFLLNSILVAVGLQLLAVYTPLSKVFGFVPISLYDLLLILLVSCPIFIFFETKKAFFSKNPK